MADVTEQKILDALAEIPYGDGDIVSQGMISGLQVKDGHVSFAVEVDPEHGPKLEPLREKAEKAAHAVPGVLTATVALTAERQTQQDAPAQGPGGPSGCAPGGMPGGEPQILMPGVKSIVAIASGKGGVGKSTTAVNLALALKAEGMKVGLFDADVFGPSIPLMLGVTGQPVQVAPGKIGVLENYGVKCMSIGFMVDADSPVIWRGPMVMSALEQLMRDVEWGQLDVLIVDMPPGTGDVQLTMAQKVPLTGAIIVSTPQDIALADARRGLNMFHKVDVPVFGIIENMSYFICPHCSERTEIFSHGGARKEAELLNVDFLGEIPLDMVIRETSDSGNPITVSDPESSHAEAYRAIARVVRDKIDESLDELKASAPKIVVQ
ncbi:MAG TPA: iron-sulfur cluster carrier protein ApbC [Rhodospirillales bacterium]|nr:iron-sulfur cluster carrier protein ApbC [Rhodospirillales bacterium]